MKLTDYHIAYFIGIGGIGMSAIARYFNESGIRVVGYDKTPSALTDALTKEGISIHFEDRVDLIPAEVTENSVKSIIIYTPAIPKSHNGFNFLKEKGHRLYKRSEVLGMITSEYTTVAVAGTHGKTTTSSMVAHLLRVANIDMVAFLGGIATNYDSNYISSSNLNNKTVTVVEADEYDRSFLTLNPTYSIVTSADADHLDIYGDADQLKESFKLFINKLQEDGKLFVNDKIADELIDKDFKKPFGTYSINRGQFFASSITTRDGIFIFSYNDESHFIGELELGVPGFHNVENATAAIAVALSLGATEEDIRKGISSYKGVKRRFEYIIRDEEIVFIDDYAHHPVEIESFLKSVRALYPEKSITAIFQPHLFSRTRDFVDGFAASLDLADRIILLDIYPAREEPIPGVSSGLILDQMQNQNKSICNKDELEMELFTQPVEVVVTIGAGDIDRLVAPLKSALERRSYEN